MSWWKVFQTRAVLGLIAFGSYLPTGRAFEIVPQSPTTEELASALGVRPFCADLRFEKPTYPRLLAEVTTADGGKSVCDVTPRGEAKDLYRIRIFLFEDAQSRVPQRLLFNLSAGDNVAGNAFIDIPEGGRLACTSSYKKDGAIYEVWIYGPESPNKLFFRVVFRVETSDVPYPMPSSRIESLP